MSRYLLLFTLAANLSAQAPVSKPAEEPESESVPEIATAASPAEAPTAINLLGKANTAAGESRRNENVQFNLVDNNAAKDLNIRLGTTATLLTAPEPERNSFAAEFGVNPSAPLHLASRAGRALHGQLFYRHLNSITSARSFFQVGGVQPARENEVGFGLLAPLGGKTSLFAEASRQRLRGNVNGNILMPLPSEREPLTTNPAEAAFVRRLLSAYPNVAPNRADIDPRMHNTNSTQSIDGENASLQLDRTVAPPARLSARYQFLSQQVTAFQLIRGQNPDTTSRSHRARLTYSRDLSPTSTLDLSAGFDRAGILIVPENNNIGPSIFIGSGALTSINGQSVVPIDRAQNDFLYAARLRRQSGNHTLSFGATLLRRQLNGYDSDTHLGTYSFRANSFGGPVNYGPIDTLRLGRATTHYRGVGHIHRGFRNFDMAFFASDTWKLSPSLTLTAGLRYRPITTPREVNNLTQLPYKSDWINFGPSLGLAWRGRAGVFRAAYSVHYGEIFAATYQQSRFNPPHNVKYLINDPDLLNPLASLPSGTPRGVFYNFQPDLTSPYSKIYAASWEHGLGKAWNLQLGYTGSRTAKMLVHWYLNRARPVDGIPNTTGTVNQRRPDSRYLDIRQVMNSARGYYDAGRVSLTSRNYHGLTLELAYWLSKNLDTGADYLSTAYDLDSFRGVSQTEFSVSRDLKGLSRFDQPHAFLTRFGYALPSASRYTRGWTVNGIVLLKSGTPFTVQTGSDAPGFGNVDGNNGDRPNLLDPAILGRTIGNPDTSRAQMPRSAFAYLRPGETAGSLGRNTFRRGGIYNVNASLERAWKLPSEFEVRLRAESVNLLNTPQFAEPGINLADTNFGSITNTLNEGRTFRFQIGLSF
jgi:hypothetical protein